MYVLIALNACLDFVLMHSLLRSPCCMFSNAALTVGKRTGESWGSLV